MFLIILKIICLFSSVLMNISWITRLKQGEGVLWNYMILNALGTVGFIVIQFNLYR